MREGGEAALSHSLNHPQTIPMSSSITTEQRQYLTYILTDEAAQTQIELVPERGGIVTQWRIRGKEMLYLDTERFAQPDLSIRGGIPILFPICGNLPGNTYQHNGQTYELKQHGFARDLPWTVEADAGMDNAIALTLESSDRTLSAYPFPFKLTFTYQLQDQSLILHQRITNPSTEPFPFSVGFHPYFQVADKSQLQFQIPASEYVNHKDLTVQPYGGNFDFNQAEIDVAFRQLSHSTASVTDGASRLTIASDGVYETLVFWTLQGKPFYCLEPWTAPRNAINTGDSLLHLAPGETWEKQIRISIESL
jgi:galactose mutarotase-like enzyme